jgi:hypothetical protein
MFVMTGDLPSNTDAQSNVQRETHLPEREDPLVLKYYGNFGACKAEVVCDDTPEEVLRGISRCMQEYHECCGP